MFKQRVLTDDYCDVQKNPKMSQSSFEIAEFGLKIQ